jgi:hypothetical protein
MTMTAVDLTITAKEANRLLRLWGFVWVGQGKNHQNFRHVATGKIQQIPKTGVLNIYQKAEIRNLLKISTEEFMAGPVLLPSPEEVEGNGKVAVVAEPLAEATGAPETPQAPVVVFDPGRHASPARLRVIRYLRERGGVLRSPNGRGLTAEMAKKLGYHSAVTMSSLLRVMEEDGQIVRDVRGKNTYEILLVEEGPGVSQVAPKTPQKAENPPQAEPEAPASVLAPDDTVFQPPVGPEPSEPEPFIPPPDLDYEELAVALLDQVFKVLSSRDPERWAEERRDLTAKLATAQEFGQVQRLKAARLEAQLETANGQLEEYRKRNAAKRQLTPEQAALMNRVPGQHLTLH